MNENMSVPQLLTDISATEISQSNHNSENKPFEYTCFNLNCPQIINEDITELNNVMDSSTSSWTRNKPKLNWNDETLVQEIARWHSCKSDNYLRGCLFSPDGTCLLSIVNMDGVQIFELPIDLYNEEFSMVQRPVTQLTPAVHIKEGIQTAVYDMAWNPIMSSILPETCWLVKLPI